MNADEARAMREEYWREHQKEIDDALEKIYAMIRERASVGLGAISFEMSDIKCSVRVERAVINQLNKDGYKLSKTFCKWTVKW